MKSQNYAKKISAVHEKLAWRSNNLKVLNIGAISELVVLMVIIGAEATPCLLNGGSLQSRIWILVNFYIFGVTCLSHLILFFLKNNKTASLLKTILRIGFWACEIVNIVENQILGDIGEEVEEYEKSSVYSYLGIYLFIIIQQVSFRNETLKRILASFTILYFSIRVSISASDPILAVYGCLLCIIMLMFYYLVQKFNPYSTKSDSRNDADNSVLKQLLSDTNEGFLVLRSDCSIYHSNQKLFTLLDANIEDPVSSLEVIKRFDTLSKEDQLHIKAQIFETLTPDKEHENQYQHGNSIYSIARDDHGEKSSGSFDSPYNENKTQAVSGFHPSSRSNEKFSPVNRYRNFHSSDLSPQYLGTSTPKGIAPADKRKSLFKSLVSQRTPKRSDSNKRRSSFTPLFNFTSGDDQTTKANNSYNLDMGSIRKKSGVERTESSQQKNRGSSGEYIFKDGIMRHFENLLRNNKNERQFSLESSISSERRRPSYQVSESIGYIPDPETSYRLLNVKTYPFPFKGKILYVVHIKDITEKEHYITLKTGEKDKDHKLSSVTHELRTPLNCIITMLGMLEKAVPGQLNEDYIKPASHSAKLLLSLINDILDHSQSKAKSLKLTYSYFNLKQNLIDVIKLMRLQAKAKGLELNLVFEDKGPRRVYSEPNRLRQIIINLIGNALKFTLKGSITLKVEYLDNHVYRISVRDTGVGIKPENLGGLFEKFSKVMDTSRINTQGIGLGLSISNRLAKMLGPSNQGITVNSIYGHGTTFSFDLESKVAMAMNESDHDFSSEDEGGSGLSRNLTELSNVPSQAQRPKIFQRHASNATIVKPELSYMRTFTGDKEEISMSVQIKAGHFLTDGQPKTAKEKRYSFLHLLPLPGTLGSKYNSTLALPKSVHTLQSVDDKIMLQEPRAASLKSKNMLEESVFTDKIEKKISIRTPDRIFRYHEDVPILVVDDNVFNIMTLEKILDKCNLRFDSATNGKIALEKILERKDSGFSQDNYRLILMDCNMPIKDGFETTQDIRALEAQNVISKIPIVAVTASTDESEIKKCFESGMDDYVPKPITLEAMKELAAKYLKITE